jgi:hypothetical protein
MAHARLVLACQRGLAKSIATCAAAGCGPKWKQSLAVGDDKKTMEEDELVSIILRGLPP